MLPDPREPSSGHIGKITESSFSPNPIPRTVKVRRQDNSIPKKRSRYCRKLVSVPSGETIVNFACDRQVHPNEEKHSESGIIKITGTGGTNIIHYTFTWSEDSQPLTVRQHHHNATK